MPDPLRCAPLAVQDRTGLLNFHEYALLCDKQIGSSALPGLDSLGVQDMVTAADVNGNPQNFLEHSPQYAKLKDLGCKHHRSQPHKAGRTVAALSLAARICSLERSLTPYAALRFQTIPPTVFILGEQMFRTGHPEALV